MKKIPFLYIAVAAVVIVLVVLLIVVVLKKPQITNTAQDSGEQQQQQVGVQGRTFIVSLDEQNNSKQNGTATFTELDGGKTKVTLTLRGGTNYNETQPAHIHVGSCPKPGEIKYKLNNLLAGASETIVDVSIDALISSGPFAVNVHESEKKMNSYIACGNLPELN